MKPELLVSVIIPVYNVEPYLEEALDSIIHQTYQNLEIIIIDDGSTDGSGNICDKYASIDKRITLIHQENRGLSAARNRGLDSMTGDVVAYLDSDDAYHPDFVSFMINTMIREDADIVVCRFSDHHTRGKLIYDGKRYYSPSIVSGSYDRFASLRALADGELNVSLWNKIYRRILWKDVRFPENHVFEEQKTILSIVNLCDRVCVVDEVLYKYRRRSESISNTITIKNRRDLILAYSQFYTFINQHTPEIFSEEQEKKAHQKWIYRMIYIYIYCSRQKGECWKRFLDDLRKKVIFESKEGRNAKIVRGILRHCPRLLQFASPIILPIYRLLRYSMARCRHR